MLTITIKVAQDNFTISAIYKKGMFTKKEDQNTDMDINS